MPLIAAVPGERACVGMSLVFVFPALLPSYLSVSLWVLWPFPRYGLDHSSDGTALLAQSGSVNTPHREQRLLKCKESFDASLLPKQLNVGEMTEKSSNIHKKDCFDYIQVMGKEKQKSIKRFGGWCWSKCKLWSKTLMNLGLQKGPKNFNNMGGSRKKHSPLLIREVTALHCWGGYGNISSQYDVVFGQQWQTVGFVSEI